MSSIALSPAGAGSLASGRQPRAVALASSKVQWLSRVVFLAVLGSLVLAILVTVTSVRWNAPLADRVDGHVMVEPGSSLWEVAVATAPSGVSPQQQLLLIEELNGVREVGSGGWQVVLLPAGDAVR